MGQLFDILDIESTLVNVEALPENPFRNRGWLAHPYGCVDEFISEQHFQQIRNISAMFNDSETLNFLSYEHHEEGFDLQGEPIVGGWETDFSWENYEQIVRPSHWSHDGLYIWPERRTWAIVTTTLEYNVLGGSKEFIYAYEAEMGGRESLAHEFRNDLISGFINVSLEGANKLMRSFYPELDL